MVSCLFRIPPTMRTIRADFVWAALYVGLNLSFVLGSPVLESHEIGRAIWKALADGRPPYDTGTEVPFAFSPLMVPVMVVASSVGIWAWGLLHVGAVLLLRTPLLIVLVIGSWGFWTAFAESNPFVFAFVAGVLAMRGSRTAAIVYMALLFLMPRPVQIPLAMYLIWTMPAIRIPAFGLFVAHGAIVLATGLADDWIAIMAAVANPWWNIGPTAWLGLGWLVAGIPLGTWLLSRGRVGWAGLAWSTYLVPHNLLMPLVERRLNLPAMVVMTLAGYISYIAGATRLG